MIRRGAAILTLVLAGCAPVPPPVTPPSTAVVSASPAPTVTATPTFADPVGPPAATLQVEGGDPVVGQLGSYASDQGGSDSPWLRGAPIVAGNREVLGLLVPGNAALADWAVQISPLDPAPGTHIRPLATGTGPVVFRAPGEGAWSIAITLHFAKGGSATYYWQLTVR
jgi:hypothetical protein